MKTEWKEGKLVHKFCGGTEFEILGSETSEISHLERENNYLKCMKCGLEGWS